MSEPTGRDSAICLECGEPYPTRHASDCSLHATGDSMNERKALERIRDLDITLDAPIGDSARLDLACKIAREALASEPESAEAGVSEGLMSTLERLDHETLAPIRDALGDAWASGTEGEPWNPDRTVWLSEIIMSTAKAVLATHAKPVEPDGWHWMCSCGESGHIGPKNFCPACGNAIEANRPWAYIGTPTGESE